MSGKMLRAQCVLYRCVVGWVKYSTSQVQLKISVIKINVTAVY